MTYKTFGLFFCIIVFATLISACQPKELTSAKIYIQSNDWPKALEQLELSVANYPDNAEAHFFLGKAYGIYERYEDMVREFETSLKLSNQFRASIAAQRENYWIKEYTAAITAQKDRDYEKAEQKFKTAIQIEPTKYEAHKNLAVNHIKTGQVDNALHLYEQLLEKNPNDRDLRLATANLYYSQGQYARTIELLHQVLSREPNNRDALANLALSYDSLGETDLARKAYENAILANPRDKDLIFLLAAHQYNQGNYTHAILLFQRVLELAPDDFEATHNIGNAYLSLAENLKTELKAANGVDSLGRVQALKTRIIQNYKQAIPYLEKALENQPNHPELWQNLGIAYINVGEMGKGEQAFLRAEGLKIKLPN